MFTIRMVCIKFSPLKWIRIRNQSADPDPANPELGNKYFSKIYEFALVFSKIKAYFLSLYYCSDNVFFGTS